MHMLGTELSIWVPVGVSRTILCDSAVSLKTSKRVKTCSAFSVCDSSWLPRQGCMSRWGWDLTFPWLSLPSSHQRGQALLKMQGFFPEGMQIGIFQCFKLSKHCVTCSDEVESTFNYLDAQDNGNERCDMSINHQTLRTTHPKNCAPAGPISTSRLANPSPSTMGGGLASLCLLTRRQVMRVGAVHFRGGMIIRMPWCRLPLIEPPRASTIKLTRKLHRKENTSMKIISKWAKIQQTQTSKH